MKMTFYIIPTVVGVLLFGALAFMGDPATVGDIPSEVVRVMTEGDVFGSWVTLIVLTSVFGLITVMGNYFLSRKHVVYGLLDWDSHLSNWDDLLKEMRSMVKSNQKANQG